MDYYISDGNPYSTSSKMIEAKQGWNTCARLILSERENEWLVESFYTKDDHRGKGLSKMMLDHVESNYGNVVIQSENDGYWKHAGFEECEDGLWRRTKET